MMNTDIMKEYRLPISDSLRKMRIQKCPLDCGDGILVEDTLETNGILKIYENLGGTFYVPQSADEIQDFPNNVVPVAGIMISTMEEEQIVQVDKIYYEFGHEEYVTKLIEQIVNFADFYGLRVSILDLRKKPFVKNKRIYRFSDSRYRILG